MLIVESSESLINRCQENFNSELKKIFSYVERNSAFEPTMAIIRMFRIVNARLDTLETELIRREREANKKQNRFWEANSVQEVIGQAIGAGSTCWVGETGAAEFDSDEAVAISSEATERIKTLLAQGKF